ncbi:hypothetical protein FGB62_123g01 [Gracilaria domingensis]|nr:hypothetical protein FGB62_123g01 [Gracilaria domingensis]
MVPDTDGGSVAFDWVMNRANDLTFLMTNLSLPAPLPSRNQENIIFMPGLSTLHQPQQGETSTEQRLRHYVKVLRSMSMAQLHPGTNMDQPHVRIRGDRAVVFRALIDGLRPVLPDNIEPREEGNELVYSIQQLDYLQAALLSFGLLDLPLTDRIRDLLDRTTLKDAQPIVLAAYSRSSIDLRVALEEHIKSSLEQGELQSAIEKRLRKLVTAVTFGSATSGFPDGPAYVHVSSFQDSLASTAGVTSLHNADKAGADAVFVNFESPFGEGSFDSHNLGAVTSQYLSIILAANDATTFRQLWEMGVNGHIVHPGNAFELLKATMVLTDATFWVWNPEEAWNGISKDFLPDGEIAEQVLREGLGNEFVDGLLRDFGPPREPLKGPKTASTSVEPGEEGGKEDRPWWSYCIVS